MSSRTSTKFANGVPDRSFPYHRCHRDAKDVALYRLVDARRQRWALYNDDADHVIHVSAVFVLRQASGSHKAQPRDGTALRRLSMSSPPAPCGLRPLGATRLTVLATTASCGRQSDGSRAGAAEENEVQALSFSAPARPRGGVGSRARATQPTPRRPLSDDAALLRLCAEVTVAPRATQPFVEYDNASDVASAMMHLHVSARSEDRAAVSFLGGVRVEDGTVVRGPDAAMVPEGRFRRVYRCFRGHDNGLLFRLVDDDEDDEDAKEVTGDMATRTALHTNRGRATRDAAARSHGRGETCTRDGSVRAAAGPCQTWAFFNDTTSYCMHIRMQMLDCGSDVVALGETTLRHEYGSSASPSRSASSLSSLLGQQHEGEEQQQQVLSAAEEGRWFHARKQKSIDAAPAGAGSEGGAAPAEAEDTPDAVLLARTADQDGAGWSVRDGDDDDVASSAGAGVRTVVFELTVPPLATRLFLRGRPSSFALHFGAEPVGNEVPEYDRVHFYRGGPDAAVIDYDQLYVCLGKDSDGLLYRLVDRGAGERWAFYNDTASLTFVVTCHFHLSRAWRGICNTSTNDSDTNDSGRAVKAARARRIEPGPEAVVLAAPRPAARATPSLRCGGDANRPAEAAAGATRGGGVNGHEDSDVGPAQVGHRLTVRKVRYPSAAAPHTSSAGHKEGDVGAGTPCGDANDRLYILSLRVPPGQTRLFMHGDVPERYELYYEARDTLPEESDGTSDERRSARHGARREAHRPGADVVLRPCDGQGGDAGRLTPRAGDAEGESEADAAGLVSAAEVHFLAGGPDRRRFDYATIYRCFATVGNGLAFRLVNATNDAWGFYNDMQDVELVVVAKFMNERDIFCNDLGPAVRAWPNDAATRLFRVRYAQDVVIERWQRPVTSASSLLLPPARTANDPTSDRNDHDENEQQRLSRSAVVAGRMRNASATLRKSASALRPLRICSSTASTHSHRSAASRVRRLSGHARTARPVTAGLGLLADSPLRQRSSASSTSFSPDSARRSEQNNNNNNNNSGSSRENSEATSGGGAALRTAAAELESVSARRVSHSVATYYTMATLVVGPGETRPFVQAIRKGTMSPFILHLRTRRAPDRAVRFVHDAALRRSTAALNFRVDEVFRCFAGRDPGMLFRLGECVDAAPLPGRQPRAATSCDADALAVVPLIDDADEWKFRCEQIDWAYYNDTTDLCFLVTVRFDARSALETLGRTTSHRQRRAGPSFSRAGLHAVTASAHSPFLTAPDADALFATAQAAAAQPTSAREGRTAQPPRHTPSDVRSVSTPLPHRRATPCDAADDTHSHTDSPCRVKGFETVCQVVVWPLRTERLVRGALVGTYSSSIRSDAAPENDKIVFRNGEPRVPGEAAANGSLLRPQGGEGRSGASYSARLYRVFPRTENGLLFRVVDDAARRWYFYNDSAAYTFAVRVRFVNSVVAPLGAARDVTGQDRRRASLTHEEANGAPSCLPKSPASATDRVDSVCIIEAVVQPRQTVAFVHAIDVVHFQVHASVSAVVGEAAHGRQR